MDTQPKTILITVDLEDWFQVENLRRCYPHRSWDSCQIRVIEPTLELLSLFEKYNVRATFFVLGWLAERVPDLISQIHNAGHEIASHGTNHDLCYKLERSALLADIKKSKAIIEDIIGQKILGFRAPNFSINEHLIEILIRAGFAYDSSFNDFQAHGRYGSLPGNWNEVTPGLLKNNEDFYEIPIKNLKLMGCIIPWAGGGYFRLVPNSIFNVGVKIFLKHNQNYLFYCHPWEFDPDQPRAVELSWNHRFRHYVNLKQNLTKFTKFLNSFSYCHFTTCIQFLQKSLSDPFPASPSNEKGGDT